MAANNLISVIPGTTGNYIVSFEIVPTGTVVLWSSILRFTNGGNCCGFGNRSPGFWFYPGSIELATVIGDSIDGDWHYTSNIPLPFNVRTKVTLEANGPDVTLSVGEAVYRDKQPTRRYCGNLTVYAGDPWHPAANAEIYNLSYKILPPTNGKTSIYIICTNYNLILDVNVITQHIEWIMPTLHVIH